MSLLHLVACTPDFLALWPRKEEVERIHSAIHSHQREFLAEAVMQTLNVDEGVLVLEDWINEAKMEDLENNWNVQPGDVRSRVDLTEWLYAMREILNDDDELRKLIPHNFEILVI